MLLIKRENYKMTTNCRTWYWRLGLASFLAIGGAIAVSGNCAKAQITPDATLGAESSVVIPLATGLPVAGLLQRPPSNNVLHLKSLTCYSTAAGGTNPDQISLYVNNKLVWGPSSMNAGNEANLTAVTGSLFPKKVRIEIFDQSKRLVAVGINTCTIKQPTPYLCKSIEKASPTRSAHATQTCD